VLLDLLPLLLLSLQDPCLRAHHRIVQLSVDARHELQLVHVEELGALLGDLEVCELRRGQVVLDVHQQHEKVERSVDHLLIKGNQVPILAHFVFFAGVDSDDLVAVGEVVVADLVLVVVVELLFIPSDLIDVYVNHDLLEEVDFDVSDHEVHDLDLLVDVLGVDEGDHELGDEVHDLELRLALSGVYRVTPQILLQIPLQRLIELLPAPNDQLVLLAGPVEEVADGLDDLEHYLIGYVVREDEDVELVGDLDEGVGHFAHNVDGSCLAVEGVAFLVSEVVLEVLEAVVAEQLQQPEDHYQLVRALLLLQHRNVILQVISIGEVEGLGVEVFETMGEAAVAIFLELFLGVLLDFLLLHIRDEVVRAHNDAVLQVRQELEVLPALHLLQKRSLDGVGLLVGEERVHELDALFGHLHVLVVLRRLPFLLRGNRIYYQIESPDLYHNVLNGVEPFGHVFLFFLGHGLLGEVLDEDQLEDREEVSLVLTALMASLQASNDLLDHKHLILLKRLIEPFFEPLDEVHDFIFSLVLLVVEIKEALDIMLHVIVAGSREFFIDHVEAELAFVLLLHYLLLLVGDLVPLLSQFLLQNVLKVPEVQIFFGIAFVDILSGLDVAFLAEVLLHDFPFLFVLFALGDEVHDGLVDLFVGGFGAGQLLDLLLHVVPLHHLVRLYALHLEQLPNLLIVLYNVVSEDLEHFLGGLLHDDQLGLVHVVLDVAVLLAVYHQRLLILIVPTPSHIELLPRLEHLHIWDDCDGIDDNLDDRFNVHDVLFVGFKELMKVITERHEGVLDLHCHLNEVLPHLRFVLLDRPVAICHKMKQPVCSVLRFLELGQIRPVLRLIFIVHERKLLPLTLQGAQPRLVVSVLIYIFLGLVFVEPDGLLFGLVGQFRLHSIPLPFNLIVPLPFRRDPSKEAHVVGAVKSQVFQDHILHHLQELLRVDIHDG